MDLVELEMALGHRVLGGTSSRYAVFDPDHLGTIAAGIDDMVSDLAKWRVPRFTQKSEAVLLCRPYVRTEKHVRTEKPH